MRNRKSDIEKYLRGELSAAEMHALEKEALGDPFLAEALEGVEQTGADNFLYDLHQISRSVHDRSRRGLMNNNKTIRMWGWTSAIAATVLLVAVSGFLVISILKDQAAQQQAMRELSSLQGDEDKKDTVFIPYPKETAPSWAGEKNKADRKKQPQFPSGGIAANGSALPERASNKEAGSTGDTAGKTSDGQDTTALEQLLALNESETERESAIKGEAARQAESPAIEQPVSKAATPQDKDKTRRDAKKTDGYASAVETPSRSPAVSESMAGDAMMLKGKVVSASDGEALAGVNVIIHGTRNGTVTNAEGNFQLEIPEDEAKIVFSFIGFLAEEVELKGQKQINVRLREDVSALSEVVVSGVASDGAPAEEAGTFRFAEPQGGRGEFNNYLNNTVKYPEEALKSATEGRVTVRFTVEPSGVLSNFEVLKGIGHGCEEALIRAIKEGPAWTPSTKGERALRDQVKVRFKFELPR